MTTRPPATPDVPFAGRGGAPDGVLRVAEPAERLAWATYSAPGDRATGINRDAVVAVTDRAEGLFAVADGMGHLKGSENASRIAGDRLTALFIRGLGDPRAFADQVSETARAVCAAIREKIELEGGDRSMGTTLTGCAVFPGRYTVFHIGDSRLYHFSGGRMIRRTEDHTRQAEAERTGIRVPEGLPPHQLTRALMYADDRTTALALYPSDGGTFPLLPGDILVACTDGVHKHLTDSDFALALEPVSDAASLGAALERLALRALVNGSTDDRSLTGVFVTGSGIRGAAAGRAGEGGTGRRLPFNMLWMAVLGAVVGIAGLAYLFLPKPAVVPPTPAPTVEATATPTPGGTEASPSPAPSPTPTPDPEAPGEETPPVIGAPVVAASPKPTPTRGVDTGDTEPRKPAKPTKPRSTEGNSRIRLPDIDSRRIRKIREQIKSRIPKRVDVEITMPKPPRTSSPTPKPRATVKPSTVDDDPRRPKGTGANRTETAKPEKTDDDPRRPRK